MPAKILLCLDTDPQPSVFDAVVAVDAGVDQLFRHSNITPEVVRDLVYGAIFTRSPAELKNTAIFVVFLLIIFFRPQGMFGRVWERT